MHDLAPLIVDLAVILGVASLMAIIFQKIRQPIVLGYLIAGIIVGPYTPPHMLITDTTNITIISELGVIFLMFSLGLEFSFHKLKRVGFSASLTGFFEVAGMLLIGFLAGKLLGWSFFDSLFLGAALSVSSTTIIIKALEELKLKKQHFAEIIFGILIVEDLLAILLLVGLSMVVVTSNIFSVDLANAALKLVLVVGGWFLLGYFLVPSIINRIKPYINEETLTLISVALCLFLVCVAAYFDYSAALGAFIMGSILAETSLIKRIEQSIKPIRDVFAAVFFVSVGMLIDPSVIFLYWETVLLLCAVTIAGKFLVTGVGSFLSGQPFTDSVRIGFGMAQIGEFSFIIAALGLTLGATSSQLYPIIIAVSAITTFTTPYLIRFSGKSSQILFKRLSPRIQEGIGSYTHTIQQLLNDFSQEPFYRKAAMRLFLNGIVVAIIFILTENLILPKIIKLLEPTWLEKGLAWIIAMILSSPFIWGMLRAFRNVQSINQADNTSSALHLSWALTALELAVLSITYFERWILSGIFFISAVILFRLFYRELDKSYQWFEDHLIDNLQAEGAHEKVEEHASIWSGDVIELEISSDSALIGAHINHQELCDHYQVNIIAIAHNKKINLVQNFHEPLLLHDKLMVQGDEQKLNVFIDNFKLHRL